MGDWVPGGTDEKSRLDGSVDDADLWTMQRANVPAYGARMTVRRAASALAIVALLVAACTAGPGALSPTLTLNPNQLADQSRSSTPVPTPRATSSPSSSPTERPSPTPYAPDLEALLPSELRAIPLQRFSLAGAAISATGDLCSFVCPGEPQALARALGIDIGQVDIAMAGPDAKVAGSPKVVIVAYRARGVATARLIPARLDSLHQGWLPMFSAQGTTVQEMTVAGKAVTWATYDYLPSPATMEYLYAHEDVLFRVVDGVELLPGVAVPADTVLAIEALP